MKVVLQIFVFLVLLVVLVVWLLITSSIIGQDLRDRKFAQSFKPSIETVEKFIKENHRLPTYSEFESIIPDERRIRFERKEVKPDLYEGSTGQNDFVLSQWRGEWSDYYSSWDKKNTAIQFWGVVLYPVLLLPWVAIIYFLKRYSDKNQSNANKTLEGISSSSAPRNPSV